MENMNTRHSHAFTNFLSKTQRLIETKDVLNPKRLNLSHFTADKIRKSKKDLWLIDFNDWAGYNPTDYNLILMASLLRKIWTLYAPKRFFKQQNHHPIFPNWNDLVWNNRIFRFKLYYLGDRQEGLIILNLRAGKRRLHKLLQNHFGNFILATLDYDRKIDNIDNSHLLPIPKWVKQEVDNTERFRLEFANNTII